MDPRRPRKHRPRRLTVKTYLNGMTSKECDTPGGGTLMTKQEGKAAADINNILANFKRTGDLGAIMQKEPQYGDFSEAVEYDRALELVRRTQEAFATWPSGLREAAANDPAMALSMLADEGGRAVLEKLGLVVNPKKENSTNDKPVLETPATS